MNHSRRPELRLYIFFLFAFQPLVRKAMYNNFISSSLIFSRKKHQTAQSSKPQKLVNLETNCIKMYLVPLEAQFYLLLPDERLSEKRTGQNCL